MIMFAKEKNMTQNQLMKYLKDKGDSTHNAIFAFANLNKLSSFRQGSARHHPAKNLISHPLVIMTNWQVPGQQQQYTRKLPLVGKRTQLRVEVIFLLKDQTRKLLMVQERNKIWKQVPRQQQQ